MPNRVWTIATHEYVTNVRRKEFIFITLGLPIVLLVLIGISALGATTVVTQMLERGPESVGMLDRSHLLAFPPDSQKVGAIKIVPYKDLSVGQSDVRNGQIAELVAVDRDYLENGRIEIYRRSGRLFDRSQAIPVDRLLARALLARTHAQPNLVARATAPMEGGSPTFVWDAKNRKFSRQTGMGEVARFLVPYLFSILLVTSIFISASYLLRGIADEKENRVIEVILSSVTPEELLMGKLIGLAAVGLTQVGLWLGIAGVPAMLLFTKVIHLSFATLGLVVVFFALGFGLYATLMAGLGSLGTTYRETQQISGFVSILAFFPYLLLTVLVEFPNGTLARVLSFIPFTAPMTMVLRITSTEVPPWEIAVSALLIAAAIWLTLKLSAKLFRFGLLIYGKRPTFKETLRWLRQS